MNSLYIKKLDYWLGSVPSIVAQQWFFRVAWKLFLNLYADHPTPLTPALVRDKMSV